MLFSSLFLPLLASVRANALSFPEPGSYLTEFTRTSAHPSSKELDPSFNSSSGVAVTLPLSGDGKDGLATIRDRRVEAIIKSTRQAALVSAWLSDLGPTGSWPSPDVDYTSGCSAQRANWPAQAHWHRLTTMAASWHGGFVKSLRYRGDQSLRDAISRGMNFWFSNDIVNPACLDRGGTSHCPCGTPGLWNTNWFSNIILIPELVVQTCLLLNDSLSESEWAGCVNIPTRAYGTFNRSVRGIGRITGANTLDIAKIGIDLALLTSEASLISDAYRRVHDEVIIQNGTNADGIRADGSFGQHGGILYNGNYGKDFTNDVLSLELAAAGTQYSADEQHRSVFDLLVEGHQWMIYRNAWTGILHWDFSVLGRIISFPVSDGQATASIKMDLRDFRKLGEEWRSEALVNFADGLSDDTCDANAGRLYGNRMFYANDYMVHRGHGYVTTVKMYSTRTKNSECKNSQNPFGFHLSDFATRTYLRGDEYEDIVAAWDWNYIPGTTVDDTTRLECRLTEAVGIEAFVGGVSDGQIGLAVMRYTDPLTRSLKWQKALFFFDDGVHHTLISGLSNTNKSASTFSVLDQRKHLGDVYVNGVIVPGGGFRGVAGSLWHGQAGYLLDNRTELVVQVANKTSDWARIGISKKPQSRVDLFTASLDHTTFDAVGYTAFPATNLTAFIAKSGMMLQWRSVETLRNDDKVGAVMDWRNDVLMVVFWALDGGEVNVDGSARSMRAVTVSSDANAAVIIRLNTGVVTLADPSQTLTTVKLTVSFRTKINPQAWDLEKTRTQTITFKLPTGGGAGAGVTQYLQVY